MPSRTSQSCWYLARICPTECVIMKQYVEISTWNWSPLQKSALLAKRESYRWMHAVCIICCVWLFQHSLLVWTCTNSPKSNLDPFQMEDVWALNTHFSKGILKISACYLPPADSVPLSNTHTSLSGLSALFVFTPNDFKACSLVSITPTSHFSRLTHTH